MTLSDLFQHFTLNARPCQMKLYAMLTVNFKTMEKDCDNVVAPLLKDAHSQRTSLKHIHAGSFHFCLSERPTPPPREPRPAALCSDSRTHGPTCRRLNTFSPTAVFSTGPVYCTCSSVLRPDSTSVDALPCLIWYAHVTPFSTYPSSLSTVDNSAVPSLMGKRTVPGRVALVDKDGLVHLPQLLTSPAPADPPRG